MFSRDQELYSSSLMYYQDDLHTQKTHTQLLAADPNFGFLEDDLKISMEDESRFSPDNFRLDSVHTDVTCLGEKGLDATDFDRDLKELVDPLLHQEDSFPLLDDDYTASLDLKLDSLDMAGSSLEELPGLNSNLRDNLSDINSILENDLLSDLGQVRPSFTLEQDPTRRQRPRRRSTRAAAVAAAATLARTMQNSADTDLENQYPTLPDLGLVKDEVSRKRQPRVSYNTLTDQERYQRIRELNNVASRNYREKKGKHLNQLEQREVQERLRSQQLHRKAEGLQQLRDQIKEFTQTFMRVHVGGGGEVPHTSH